MIEFAAFRLLQVPLLSGLSAAQISALCGTLKPITAEPKQALIAADGPETFYIVEAGTCVVITAGGKVNNFGFKVQVCRLLTRVAAQRCLA